MTNEEAKEILGKTTFAFELGEETVTHKEIYEALDLAIKALEQQPCEKCEVGNPCLYCEYDFTEKKTKHPCEDYISRKAVLDLVKSGVLISNGNYKSVCKAIEELPSVTPSKQDLKEAYINGYDYGVKDWFDNAKRKINVDEWLSSFNTDSATECFTAVQKLKGRIQNEEN